MEKRYQVFISSTSRDLQPARREVSEALLKSGCFPAQMELWGAVDEEQFEYIRQMIDLSDYFIVISAGMYGSIHPDTGISFTEMEFDYAQEKGVPTLRFVHGDPFRTLTGEFIEQSDDRRAKLEAFHAKLKDGRLCKLWGEPAELGREVILGLNDLKNRRPATGWVRGDRLASEETEILIANLRRQLAEVELSAARDSPGDDIRAAINFAVSVINPLIPAEQPMSNETLYRAFHCILDQAYNGSSQSAVVAALQTKILSNWDKEESEKLARQILRAFDVVGAIETDENVRPSTTRFGHRMASYLAMMRDIGFEPFDRDLASSSKKQKRDGT